MKKLLLSFAALALVASGSVFAMEGKQTNEQTQQPSKTKKKNNNKSTWSTLTLWEKLTEKSSVRPSPRSQFRINKIKIASATGDAAMLGGGLGLGSYIKEKLDQGKTWKEIMWEARKDKKAILSATLTTIGLGSKTYSYLG